MLKKISVSFTLLLAAYFAPINLTSGSEQFSELQLMPKSRPLINFTLAEVSGAPFTEKSLIGKWSLIFFGFTHCPDICPLELKILSEVLTLEQTHKENVTQAVFISLDPERDALTTIAAYAKNFNGDIKGATGSNAELVKLTRFFGADYNRRAQSDGAPLNVPAGINMPANITGDYQVNHPARIYLVNPQGEYVGSFPPPHNAYTIWNDLHLIIKR